MNMHAEFTYIISLPLHKAAARKETETENLRQ